MIDTASQFCAAPSTTRALPSLGASSGGLCLAERPALLAGCLGAQGTAMPTGGKGRARNGWRTSSLGAPPVHQGAMGELRPYDVTDQSFITDTSVHSFDRIFTDARSGPPTCSPPV